jgi:four helix bundle protein
MRLAKLVYAITASFPREEGFGLASQIQRSAVSIPSNIAEGNARQSRRDYARFVSMAADSAAELQTQLLLTQELGVSESADLVEGLALCEQVSKMLYRLQQSLMRDSRWSPVPGPRSRVSEDAEEYP